MEPKRVTVRTLREMKKKGEKITMLTAYDYPMALVVDRAEIDVILVGDSLSMVIQGHENSLPVTMDEMIYHTKIVARATKRAMVVGDMPFMSYQLGPEQAVANAGRFLKEAGAHAVKLEGGEEVVEIIRAITRMHIPVMAHIGLTPQAIHEMGGFVIQREAERLLRDAESVQEAGAFSIVLEGIPAEIGKRITDSLDIPTIGIGAGPDCDGQVLVAHDLLGLFERFTPKFVKRYANLGEAMAQAFTAYREEVRTGKFPGPEHSF